MSGMESIMSVKIIRGAIGSHKNRLCIEEIEKRHKENPECKCIMLVPDHYSFETEREFVKHFGGTGLNNIEVLTPAKLAIEFLPANNLKHLSDSGRQMLISRAIKEYCEEAQSSLLIRTMKTAGFPHTMERIIAELKKYCVTPDMLDNGIKLSENEMLSEKISAISAIYRKYNFFFEEGEYTDSNDDLHAIAQNIPQNDFFNENLYVWVNFFDEFLPGHMAVLEAMSEKNVNITVCLNYPKEDKNEVYASVSEAYEKVRSLRGYTEDVLCEGELNYINSESIRYLLENYNDLTAKFEDETSDISIFAARDSYSEIERTASEILRLVRTGEYRFRDIVVMCGNFEEVKHIIKAVFDEYEIPYFSDEKIMLLDHPIAMQILSVFDIFEEDWSYASVMRYLRSGFIYDEKFKRIEQSEIDRLDNFLLKYGIRGRKKWEEETWTTEQDSFEKVWGDVPFEEIQDENVNSIKNIISKPLLELSKKIKSGKTAYSYAKALFEFMESIRMYGGLRNDVKAFEESGKTDEAAKFSEIWNLILEILDQTVVTMGERKITFSEYGEYIRAGLSQCEIKTIPSSIDSVCIGTVERSTASPIKALFVTGAVNGTYPSDMPDEGLLSDMDRGVLKEQCGIVIAPDTRHRMEQQYFKVYKALATVTDKLFISYHVQNGDGKAVGTSTLVQDIQSVFVNLKTQDNIITDYADRSYISAPAATLHKLFINKSKNSKSFNKSEWDKVYRWFREDEEYSEKLRILESASAFDLKAVKLKEETATELFGEESVYSASRLNVYAMCPFSYFMKYGLDAKEQEISKVAANDFGSYAHRFIQEFCYRVEEGANTPQEKLAKWRQLSDLQRNECIDDITNETKTKIKEFNLYDEEKRCNIIDRISKTVKGSAAVVHKSLKRGKYTASGYEQEFEKIQLSENVYITGAVDRVDSYVENDREYIRIIDYKTGNTGFDILNIYDGVNMQMVIYAVAVKKAQEELKNREVNLSGIFYNKLKNELVKSENADTAKHEQIKSMRLDGVIFADETEDGKIDMESLYAVDEDMKLSVEQKNAYKSDFVPMGMYKNGKITGGVHTETEGKALMKHVTDKICNIDSSIKKGNIDVSPYEENSTSNACKWCLFKEACVFERENTQMRKTKGTKEEAWKNIVREYKESEKNG